MRTAVLMLMLMLMLVGAAACAPYSPYAPPPPPGAGAWPPPPVHAPRPEQDQCGASGYRWLVGRSRAEIPPPPPGALWRVVARGDAMTRDLRPTRLNIIYDRRTHRVLEVWCG